MRFVVYKLWIYNPTWKRPEEKNYFKINTDDYIVPPKEKKVINKKWWLKSNKILNKIKYDKIFGGTVSSRNHLLQNTKLKSR